MKGYKKEERTRGKSGDLKKHIKEKEN